VYFESRHIGVALKGLSLFECSSDYGALYDYLVRAATTGSNLTSLGGEAGGYALITGAILQDGSGVSTNGSFLLFARCSGGYGCFVKYDGSAVFRQCLFVDNSVGAIAHLSGPPQTRRESCYIFNTKLRGDRFDVGSVVVVSCLFAGEIQPMPASFIPTGVQISFTSTEISIDTASLLPLCDEYGKFCTPKGTETPKRTGTTATGESHEREDVLATRQARIIPFIVLQLALLALGFTL
jgi:hypothetical protein